ncbi:MAG: ATP-binding protein [Firmicutes bacterium]|nr:ATP-binding protein [Bacillota bacterium]
MKIIRYLKRLGNERSFPLALQMIVLLAAVTSLAVLYLFYRDNTLDGGGARVMLYFCFVLIFMSSFFNSFFAGIAVATVSSLLAVAVLLPPTAASSSLETATFYIFPFIGLFFLTAIITDWFSNSTERLRRQILENERLHQQAKHMEKLSLAGEIAAGIAHEIRNPLTVIKGYIQVLQKSSADDSYTREIYGLILEEAQRTNEIISNFLCFSRPDQPQKTMVQINELIENATTLLYGEALRKNVQLSFYPATDLPLLCLDKDQMMQVFLNLSSNALQAMPQGGSLSILTLLDKKEHQVLIYVSDTGHGIAPTNLEKIFTPFFTTREEGTGLGLSISQNIIAAHHGQIKAESIPGQGSRFTISLPLTTDGADHC